MLITQIQQQSFDLSSEVEVLAAIFTGTEIQNAIARIDLNGATPQGSYQVRVYINDCTIAPDAPIVANGSSVTFQSRHFIVKPGDSISLHVAGESDDTSVVVNAYLMTSGFNHEELVNALSRLEVRPERVVLQPQPAKIHPFAKDGNWQRL
jgi:hypothetical protein